MRKEKRSDGRLVIVSNRLPVVMQKIEKKKVKFKHAVGGLVTALSPVMKKRGGLWVGWAGNYEEEGVDTRRLLDAATAKVGYDLVPVELSIKNFDLYYKGYSNEILWPLFHNFSSYCNFVPAYFTAYKEVNKKFADTVFENLNESDFVWVHDYHLIKVAHYLREAGVKNRLAFFLHIPFPPLETFMRLPCRLELLEAMLEYDLVGFQTELDKKNFTDAVGHMMSIRAEKSAHESIFRIATFEKTVKIGSFPISIDFEEFSASAMKKKVRKKSSEFKENSPDQVLMLGVDRLDYTKGIPQRLYAYKILLEDNPDLRGRIKLIQIMVPSRVDIPQYANLKSEIERLIGEINGRFSLPGWIPIEYRYRTLAREELLAYYSACEIALVTPLKDGMNLVAKEYCAASNDENGVLILSEFAGAVAQLKTGAIRVNPFDENALAKAMKKAFFMPVEKKRRRMRRLRQQIIKYDIYWWVDTFLAASTDCQE
jgi:trehalose 6-phosphate synthase/phosphatase